MRKPKKKITAEYTPPGENSPWAVQEFLRLSTDFGGVSEAQLPEFHSVALPLRKPFAVARMLYGINPVIPKLDSNPEFFRVFTMDEIAAELQLESVKEIDGQLELLAFAWQKHIGGRPKPATEAPKPSPKPTIKQPAVSPEQTDDLSIPGSILSEAQLSLMRQFGFDVSIFLVDDRPLELANAEIKWFGERIVELKKMFEEPMAKSLARQALLNELFMRRCDDQMTRTAPSSKPFMVLQDTKLRLEQTYQAQWKQLEEICPYVKGVVGKVTFAGVVSDLVEAYKKWKANKDNTLIDGLFTAFEIQVLLRHSVQADVRYRPGLVAAINEAKLGLWDPNWRRGMPNSLVKAMDEGFKDAFSRVIAETGTPVVDLERDDEKGEYPDLIEAAPEELAIPDENVELEGDSAG